LTFWGIDDSDPCQLFAPVWVDVLAAMEVAVRNFGSMLNFNKGRAGRELDVMFSGCSRSSR